jgi:hypothetical protein
VVYSPSRVALNYLKTWFCLDLISGIPFGLFDLKLFAQFSFVKVLKGSRIIKAFKILRFLKLTRLLKGTKILQHIDRDTVDRYE